MMTRSCHICAEGTDCGRCAWIEDEELTLIVEAEAKYGPYSDDYESALAEIARRLRKHGSLVGTRLA